MRLVGQECELDRRHAASSARLLPVVEPVPDLAWRRDAVDPYEPDPFHMTHHGDAHAKKLHTDSPGATSQEAVAARFTE